VANRSVLARDPFARRNPWSLAHDSNRSHFGVSCKPGAIQISVKPSTLPRDPSCRQPILWPDRRHFCSTEAYAG